MTNRERFNRIMSFERGDRVPLLEVENYEVQAVNRWRNEGLPADISVIDYLELDRLQPIWCDTWLLPRYEHEVLAEDENYITFRDGIGVVTKADKEQPDYIYIHLEHPLKTRRDWEEIRERLDPMDPARWPDNWLSEMVPMYNNSTDPVGLIIHPFFNRFGYYMIGTENFMYMFYDDPELVHEIFEFLADFTIKHSERVLKDVKVDYVAIAEDVAFSHSSFVSPAMYRDFWMPYQPGVIKALKDAGAPVVSLWSSGDIRPIFPQAVEAGFNSTWPLESAVGITPNALREEYGEALTLMGGIAIRALIDGKDAIRREIETKVLPLWEQGGYIPTVDDMTPPDVSFENYCYYIELLKAIR